MEFDAIEAGGSRIGVTVERARLRNAHANVSNGAVVIRLPAWMNENEAEEAAGSLYRRMKRAIERNPGRFLASKSLEFADGQITRIAGREIAISVVRNAKRPMARLAGGSMRVYVPAGADERRLVSRLAARVFAELARPVIEKRVAELNEKYFGSRISAVRVRDNSTVWGSCSPKNAITINLKLLYAPESVLDYVIVHELAHTLVRSHSKRFWKVVEEAMPAYREARLWLKDSSHLVKT